LKGSSGPAVIAVNCWPQRTKSTTFTEPGGPLGDSLGIVTTRTTRESGKSEA